MNKPGIAISAAARSDLDGIWEYIAADNITAADRWLKQLLWRCESYANQPSLGEARFDLMPGCRHFSVGMYVVYYRPSKIGIEIIRVLHGARHVNTLE